MLIADVNDFLACFCSLNAKLLFHHLGFLRVADALDLLFTLVLFNLLFLEHLEKLVIETLTHKVHVFLCLYHIIVAWASHRLRLGVSWTLGSLFLISDRLESDVSWDLCSFT